MGNYQWNGVLYLGGKTPYERYYGRPPDVSHMQPFMARCWILQLPC